MSHSIKIAVPFQSLVHAMRGNHPMLSNLTPEARECRADQRTSQFADVLQQTNDRFTTTPTDGRQLDRVLKPPKYLG